MYLCTLSEFLCIMDDGVSWHGQWEGKLHVHMYMYMYVCDETVIIGH